MIRRAVVFDLDNTLTESKPPITQTREVIDAPLRD
jgi:FMN phosphatase YigB (HAD superfamily)